MLLGNIICNNRCDRGCKGGSTMRLERLNDDKIRIFLTFDDLTERGIEKDDMWRDIPKVHELFNDMMDEAYTEFGFDISGPVAVEVFALPAQGMVVIVSRGKGEPRSNDDNDEDEDLYELEVTIEESDQIIYSFTELEFLIQISKRLSTFFSHKNTSFYYKNKYYLVLDSEELEEIELQKIIANMSEFGEASTITLEMLQEYGKLIVEHDAIQTFSKYF